MNGLDTAIVLAYLIGILGFSYALHRKKRTADVFVAGRAMGWFPIGLSVMITLFSAVNFLAFPTEVMEHGLYVLAALPVFVLVAIPITRIFIPFFHRMQLTSLYAYLEQRFDRHTRLLASGLFMFWRLCWMATALYATAQVLSIMTGIPSPALIIVAGSVAALYTATGGIRTVMWTDVLQFLLLVTGIGGALWVAVGTHGQGWSALWSEARTAGHLSPFLPVDPVFYSLNPTIRITLWSGLIGTFVAFLGRYTADQMVVQRYFAARSLSAAVRGFWWNIVAALFALVLLTFLGLAIAGTHSDATIPAMARFGAFAQSLPFGLTGILTAGLLAATMSSVDSGLNSCLATWLTDFAGRKKQDDGQQAHAYRLRVFGLAIATMVLAFIVGRTGDLFEVINRVINGVGSPLLALILLGMFSRSANARGTWIGGSIGIIASLAISFGWDGLALHYYAVINLLVTLAACLIASALTAHRDPVTPSQMDWIWRPARH